MQEEIQKKVIELVNQLPRERQRKYEGVLEELGAPIVEPEPEPDPVQVKLEEHGLKFQEIETKYNDKLAGIETALSEVGGAAKSEATKLSERIAALKASITKGLKEKDASIESQKLQLAEVKGELTEILARTVVLAESDVLSTKELMLLQAAITDIKSSIPPAVSVSAGKNVEVEKIVRPNGSVNYKVSARQTAAILPVGGSVDVEPTVHSLIALSRLPPLIAGNFYCTDSVEQDLAAAAVSMNIIYLAPYYSREDHTYSEIGIRVTTGVDQARIRFGIYDTNQAGLVYDLGEAVVSGTGAQDASVVTNFSLSKDKLYYLAIIFNTDMSFLCNASNTMPSAVFGWQAYSTTRSYGHLRRSMTYGALPDPLGATSQSNSVFPIVKIRA